MRDGLTHAATLVVVALAGALSACAGEPDVEGTESTVAAEAQKPHGRGAASAVLRDASGAFVGRVVFVPARDRTTVIVSAALPAGTSGIHGFHVHANDNPANGDGCVADPAQPAATHFVSADGHYNPGGATHGGHAGDMPALFFTADGEAAMTFVTDRFAPGEIEGKAVVLHAGPDNYGNVPVGAAANQYTPNAPDATTLTQATGNAGARLACGVIR
jgi:Cu-Zn family superoxide dismutase